MLPPYLLSGLPSGGGGGAGYTTGAVHFDGATWIDKALPLPGGVASSVYLFSGWFKNPVEMPGNTAHSMNFFCTFPNVEAEVTGVFVGGGGGMFATLNQNSAPDGGYAHGVVFPPDLTGWHHFAVSADFSIGDPNNVYQFYLDGSPVSVDALYGTSTPFAFPWNSTADETNIFFLNDGYQDVLTSVDIADLYFNPYERIDLSVPANLAKFISAGRPVDLGADGSAVTGTAPAFFFRRAAGDTAASFATNRGTAGDGTLTGTLTTASTSPTD